MKKCNTVKEAAGKSFSVNAMDKKKIKARVFETMRTSFAIEGIRFTDAEFNALKTGGHLQKQTLH